jgi:hypothetical protein
VLGGTSTMLAMVVVAYQNLLEQQAKQSGIATVQERVLEHPESFERAQPGGVPAEKHLLIGGIATVQLLGVSSFPGRFRSCRADPV